MSSALQIQTDALIAALGSCLCTRLEASVEDGIPAVCLCAIIPGSDVPANYCADGGVAWTRLVSVLPIVDQVQGEYSCSNQWEITVEVGILRCAPMMNEDGGLPSMEEWLSATLQQNYDMGLMLETLMCCSTPNRFEGPAVGAYVPQGPEGTCVGGSWTAKWAFS